MDFAQSWPSLRRGCLTQSLEVDTAEGPVLGIVPDLDLLRDLKIEILSIHQKRLVASFRSPPRPSRCGY